MVLLFPLHVKQANAHGLVLSLFLSSFPHSLPGKYDPVKYIPSQVSLSSDEFPDLIDANYNDVSLTPQTQHFQN